AQPVITLLQQHGQSSHKLLLPQISASQKKSAIHLPPTQGNACIQPTPVSIPLSSAPVVSVSSTLPPLLSPSATPLSPPLPDPLPYSNNTQGKPQGSLSISISPFQALLRQAFGDQSNNIYPTPLPSVVPTNSTTASVSSEVAASNTISTEKTSIKM